MNDPKRTTFYLDDSGVEVYVTDGLCILEDGACNSILLEGDDAKRLAECLFGGLTEKEEA